MLILKIERHSNCWVDLTIPPSAETRQVRVCLNQICSDGSVRLGFDAPREIEILRSEAITRQQKVRP